MQERGSIRRLEVTEVSGLTVVRLQAQHILAEDAVRGLGRDLARLLQDPGRRRLVLDFAAVELLSSSFLDVLVKLHKEAQDVGGRLAVCGLRSDVAQALAITGLDRVFAIYPGRQQALASFGSG